MFVNVGIICVVYSVLSLIVYNSYRSVILLMRNWRGLVADIEDIKINLSTAV